MLPVFLTARDEILDCAETTSAHVCTREPPRRADLMEAKIQSALVSLKAAPEKEVAKHGQQLDVKSAAAMGTSRHQREAGLTRIISNTDS